MCKLDKLTADQAAAFEASIEDDYKINMILDNLPAARVYIVPNQNGEPTKTYERGIYVGFKANVQDVAVDGKNEMMSFLNNHLRFNILYHRDAVTDLSRIVGFEVEAFSVQVGHS